MLIVCRMPIDYSKWKAIEVSDDEDDTHPNIDTPSLFRFARFSCYVRTSQPYRSVISF